MDCLPPLSLTLQLICSKLSLVFLKINILFDKNEEDKHSWENC